jgi:tRNA threonylcarbamoyladenosine biosynthesis protein TsaB
MKSPYSASASGSWLSIETSSEACSVALRIDGTIREKFEHAPRRHAELLLPMVLSLLAEAELTLSQLDGIAFGRGPGSFTSLRIGIGVVQGLAWGSDLPVAPVSSLAAVAQTVLDQLVRLRSPEPKIRRVCVAMDARMKEVYCANFDVEADRIVNLSGGEQVCPPSYVLSGIRAESAAEVCAAGNGFERYPELEKLGTELGLCIPECWPRASAVSRLADQWLEHNSPLPADQAQPVYLRNQVAVKPHIA